GPLRGGKYSLFEAGTRVPFMVYWKGKIQPKVSDALVCQVDLLSSLAELVGSDQQGPDSEKLLDVFMGNSDQGREELVIEATSRTALRKGDWIMIPPYKGPKVAEQVDIELGNEENYQLYDLKNDIGQMNNQAKNKPKKLAEMLKAYHEIYGDENREIEALELK
ncbi:sulfatase family protein, partial [Echinicola sediminis]